MRHVTILLLLTVLTSCSTVEVVPVLEPRCVQTQGITSAEYGTQEWLNALSVELTKLKECIRSWEDAVRTHNRP